MPPQDKEQQIRALQRRIAMRRKSRKAISDLTKLKQEIRRERKARRQSI